MAGRAARPYFKHSITELEALFDQAQSDIKTLQILGHELGYRDTNRAARLRTRVTDSLAALTVDLPHAAPGGSGGSLPADPPVAVIAAPHNSAGQPPTPSPSKQAQTPANTAISPVENLGKMPSFPIPKRRNEPQAILAVWTVIEALSPQTYRRPEDLAAGDRRCVADLSSGRVPWGTGERSRPKMQLYYQVILGSIPMEQATKDLVKAFGEDQELHQRTGEKAAIGAVLVDRNGIVVEENGIAVSSFAWALPLCVKQNLGILGAWPHIESHVIEKLEGILRRVDSDGNPVALDLTTVDKAHRWLVAQFSLPEHLVEPPKFALRVYHYFKAKTPPEALLLNSFFLEDIARIANHVSQNAASIGLRRYLGIDKPKETFNLLADEAALEKAVAPATMPAARWPVPGGHPLVMLQQAAVNLARSELAGGEGIIAVNGPPGTGKTTLLRDVVAACVLDRALAMAAFDDPEKAFTASGEKISAGEKAFFQLYTLAPGLKGYEMLVASSNNKAVENISKELPAAKAIGRTTDEINYFKSVSDLLHAPGKAVDADGEDEKVATEPTETWGLIAAVLGNAQNRAAFQQSFWWHENCGFRLYLKAAKGDSVVREIRDPDTGCIIERTTPSVVRNENPPSPQYAKSLWRRARNRLIALRNEIAAELKTLEAVRQSCLRLAEVRHGVVAQESACAAMQARLTPLIETTSQLKIDVATTEDQLAQRGADLKKHGQIRPGILARLFRTERWKTWLTANATLLETEVDAARQLQTSKHRLAEATAARDALAANIFKAEESLAILRQQIAQLSQAVERQRSVLGDRLVDEQFFARGHEASNIAAPWIPDRLHRKREDLFVAALAVHRAFIDASAQKVLHNLSVLMDVFSSGSMQNEAKRKLLGDLWSTLFLVVPVISTTFASVNRMLGDLPVGSIGWLLIDEAGQALPQAAVGAIMRAKRSVVVGDPLQIPPVVTLPERLTLEICNYFKVDKSVWAAPEASAQTLTDQASRFQAAFGADRGPRCVGIPLLVHRRCQEPMFGISNRIAYDGQMVHAPGPRMTGAIGAILGPSKWLDIDGEADSKWCPAEGELVVSLLKKIAAADITDPDLFIITPFRIVAQEIRRRLERERELLSLLRVDPGTWGNNRVGTIHTVQGREAEAVIIVLGAPKAVHNGARSWAAGTPNILNVAVSRAKQNLYVVGSHGAWSGVGHARELASSLPRVRSQTAP